MEVLTRPNKCFLAVRSSLSISGASWERILGTFGLRPNNPIQALWTPCIESVVVLFRTFTRLVWSWAFSEPRSKDLESLVELADRLERFNPKIFFG